MPSSLKLSSSSSSQSPLAAYCYSSSSYCFSFQLFVLFFFCSFSEQQQQYYGAYGSSSSSSSWIGNLNVTLPPTSSQISFVSRMLKSTDGGGGYINFDHATFRTPFGDASSIDTVVDIAFFHVPDQCALREDGCMEHWPTLGVGVADPANKNKANIPKFYWCCTVELVEQGLCKESTVGQLILDMDVTNDPNSNRPVRSGNFMGKHRFVNVPKTGRMNTKLAHGNVLEKYNGDYIVLMANCHDAGRKVKLVGSWEWSDDDDDNDDDDTTSSSSSSPRPQPTLVQTISLNNEGAVITASNSNDSTMNIAAEEEKIKEIEEEGEDVTDNEIEEEEEEEEEEVTGWIGGPPRPPYNTQPPATSSTTTTTAAGGSNSDVDLKADFATLVEIARADINSLPTWEPVMVAIILCVALLYALYRCCYCGSCCGIGGGGSGLQKGGGGGAHQLLSQNEDDDDSTVLMELVPPSVPRFHPSFRAAGYGVASGSRTSSRGGSGGGGSSSSTVYRDDPLGGKFRNII